MSVPLPRKDYPVALEIISSAPCYDSHVVETTPVRLRYDLFGNTVEVTRWASAP